MNSRVMVESPMKSASSSPMPILAMIFLRSEKLSSIARSSSENPPTTTIERTSPGWRTAIACAVEPPSEEPSTSTLSHPAARASAAKSSAQSSEP